MMIFFAASVSAPASVAPDAAAGQAALATLVFLLVVGSWFVLRALVRNLRAGKTHAATGGRFRDYALEALVNAAKIDGRVNAEERVAIVAAMKEAAHEETDAAAVDAAFARARLSKDELVAYLSARSRQFSRDQKVALLKALLSVFVADGRFDESEHAALVDYTAAIGFERKTAPQMLRGIARDFTRGNIT